MTYLEGHVRGLTNCLTQPGPASSQSKKLWKSRPKSEQLCSYSIVRCSRFMFVIDTTPATLRLCVGSSDQYIAIERMQPIHPTKRRSNHKNQSKREKNRTITSAEWRGVLREPPLRCSDNEKQKYPHGSLRLAALWEKQPRQKKILFKNADESSPRGRQQRCKIPTTTKSVPPGRKNGNRWDSEQHFAMNPPFHPICSLSKSALE